MISTGSYKAKQFNLSGLNGISDRTLEMHFKLYEGYVKETNKLTEKIAEFLSGRKGRSGRDAGLLRAEAPARLRVQRHGAARILLRQYEERRRQAIRTKSSAFYKAAEASFGSYDIWKADFVGIGKMRGVGWAICYQIRRTVRLSNHWISLHETGNVAGFIPVLVMDVWEHAFLLDYKPADRPKYIEAFFSNID